MKTKRTGLDVLHQLHAAVGLVHTHPERVEEAARSMTPEQLRKVHDGLVMLIHCIGPGVSTAATVAEKSHAAPASPAAPIPLAPAASSTAKPAARAEPATESS